MRRDHNVKQCRNKFSESGPKIKNRKSPAAALTGEGEDEMEFEQYEEIPRTNNDRADIVRCKWCSRRCPKAAIQFHVMASHMCGSISLASLGDELPETPGAEETVEAQAGREEAEAAQAEAQQ